MSATPQPEVAPGELAFRPLRPETVADLGAVLRGSWGAGCWCMHPRLTDAQTRALLAEAEGSRAGSALRRAAMTERARRAPAPGLIAYAGETPVGWVAVAPRGELARVDAARATPRVDEIPVWVIPCVTVRKGGRGIGVALIRAAVAYARAHGAPAVEAYPRAAGRRVGDDAAFFGTEPMFRRAGFEVIRPPLPARTHNAVRRPAMRLTFAP